MSSENNEFQIPFSLSRRGKKEEINFKSIGRRIGSAAASRLIDRPNIGGKRRRGARGLGMPDGDLNPRTRIDVDGDGTIFDNIPGWEQPDPTPPRNSTPSLASGAEKSEKPSFPRKPTYGPFIDDAAKKFGEAKTWEEFKEIYENTEITYIDYETTGLVFDEFSESSGNGSPTQLGAVKMKGGKVLARFETYINPGIPTEQWEKWSRDTLVDYDGKPITNDFIQRQISIAEAHKKLAEFIGPNAILGVQNAAFDKDVLEDNLVASGIDWRPDGWIDLKDVAEMSLPRWSEDNQDGPKKFNKKENKFVPSNSLKDITEYLEVELGDKHHTADADAEATAKSMAALIDRAIDSDWPTNLFDAQKREAKLKKEADNYDSGIKTFRSEKEKYIAELKAEQDASLSSGAKKRPIIKVTPPVSKTQTSKKRPLIVFGKDEKKLLSQHRATNYKYGDESVLGGAVRATKNNWLKGMTSQQIAELIVPKSRDQHFMMWVDDLAPGAYGNPAALAAFKKYYDEILTNSPWDEVDYSEANIRASQDAIALLLDSSPQMKWAVENHGTPFVGVMSAKAVSNYEAIPEVANKLDMLQRSRGVEKRPYVRARLVPGTNMLIFNKRMLIDRESSLSNEKIPFMWSDTHMPLASDSHIDNSVVSTIPHEWGHWLVFRALKDLENRVGSKKDNKSNFFGSGDTEDDNYLKALLTAEKYTDTEMNPKLMALWDAGTPIEDTKDTSRVLTSYGHVNPAETFAEGVVAYFHPNPEVRKNAINQTLRDDIEAIIGNGDGKKPWDENKDFEIALSSGRTSSQRSARRETNLNASEQVFSSTSEDDRELARLDYSLSLSSGAIVPESGSRKLGIINDFDDRNNDGFATPIRNVRFRDSNGEDVEYTIFATGKLGDAVYVFEKSKLDKYVSDKEKSISLANGVPFEDVGVSVISRMTEEREIRNKKNGLVGKMSIFPPTENMVVGKLRMSGNKNGTSIIDEIAIDKKHQRRGLASALFKYHRDFWPDQDLHHSSTLSDDGKAFAAATPFDDNDISLSSGAKYAEIVRNQPKLSNEQFDSSENFKELIQLDELRKEDTLATTGVDAFGDDITELADSEDRANIKKDIQQSLETLFSYEMELDESIIVSSNSGDKINLGNKVKVTAVYSDVGVSSLTENDILEQVKELEYMFIGEDGKPLTRIDVKFKISPADSSSTEKLLALGVPQSLIDVDNPGTNIELGRAHRAILTDGSKTVVIHESISIGKDARKNGLASAFNARNESLYRGIDADSIITYGMSSTTSDQLGATHWARNGFTILGEPSRQKFIGVIDDAILNKPDSFSEEEIKRISSLYKKDKKTGKFISSATPEELIDFTKADEIFKLANNGDGTAIFFTREVAKPSGINRVTNRINRRVGSERIREQSDSVSLSSRAGHKTKLNVERYGKNGEYSEVSSFELNGKTFNVSKGGDSPGRGAYNGYLAAFDNGENIAHIDYQLDTNDFKAVVAMVFTKEEYRRSGIAEALLDSFMLENPNYELSPGYTTEDGAKWWRSVTGGDGPIKASLNKNRSDSPSLSSGAFDYRGLHGAPGRGSGAPLHDLVSPDYSVYPEDVYSSNAIKYYGVGDDNFDAAAFDLIRRFKGKPNAEVTIYRAAPVSKAKRIEKLEKQIARYMSRGKRPAGFDRNIEPHVWSQNTRDEIERLKKLPPEDLSIRQGDWVTPIRSYAVSHGDGALRGDYEIVKKRVKAKHVYTAGDSWLEWGYDDSKGSLSLSSGKQPRINLSDEEKREIINIASQRTDSFSKSVVAQFRQNGYLSEKQWTALNRMTLRRNRSGPSLSSGSLINSKKYKKTHTASLKKILKRMDKEGSGWMDEDMRIARLDELESHFGKTLRETVEYWYGGADNVTYNMREEIEEGRASKEVGELLGLIDISPTTSRPIYRGMRYLTQDQLDEIINRGVKLPLGAFSGQKSTALSYADGDSFNKTQVSVVFRLEPGVKAFPMKHFSPIDEEEYLVSGTFEVVNVSQTPFGRFGRTVTEVEIRQTDSGQSLSSGAKPQFLPIENQAAARDLNTDTNQKRENDEPSLSSGGDRNLNIYSDKIDADIVSSAIAKKKKIDKLRKERIKDLSDNGYGDESKSSIERQDEHIKFYMDYVNEDGEDGEFRAKWKKKPYPVLTDMEEAVSLGSPHLIPLSEIEEEAKKLGITIRNPRHQMFIRERPFRASEPYDPDADDRERLRVFEKHRSMQNGDTITDWSDLEIRVMDLSFEILNDDIELNETNNSESKRQKIREEKPDSRPGLFLEPPNPELRSFDSLSMDEQEELITRRIKDSIRWNQYWDLSRKFSDRAEFRDDSFRKEDGSIGTRIRYDHETLKRKPRKKTRAELIKIGEREYRKSVAERDKKKRENDGPSLSSGADIKKFTVEEFKDMSNEEHARILSEAGLSQRYEAEAAGQAIWNEGFPGLYQVTLEHAGDLYHRSQHRLKYGAYGLDELDEKLTKLLRWLEAKYSFRRDVEEQTEQQIRNVDPSLSRDLLVSLGKKYTDAHSKLPVYTLPTELMVKASMHLGNWEFEDAAKTLKELKEMLKDKKKWRFMLSRQGTIQYLESKKLNGTPSLMSEVLDSKSTENFTSTKAIEKLEQANKILDRIAPDGDILQKVLGLRESESQKLSVGSNLPLTDKEVEFIGDVVSVGTLINEAIEAEVINLGGSDGDAVAKLQAEFSLLNENMLLYGPTVLKLQKDINKFKAKKPIAVQAVIHGVPEDSNGLDSISGSRSHNLYPQLNADELLSIIEKYQGSGVDNYVLGLSETVPEQVHTIWQDAPVEWVSSDEVIAHLKKFGKRKEIAEIAQPSPSLHTPRIILRTNKNESVESDQEKLEIVKKNLPLVRDVQQLLRNVNKALNQKQNGTESTPLDTAISQGYRFSDKEILDMLTRTSFYGELESLIPNYDEHEDKLGYIRDIDYIGDKNGDNLTWENLKTSVETYGLKPNDEIWIKSVTSDDIVISERQRHPPHKFRMSFNPITEEYSIELIEAIVHGTNIKSGDKIIDVNLAESYLRETILRHVQSLRLSKEQKQELFIQKFREVVESKKVAKVVEAADTVSITELNIGGEIYPAGTKYSVLEDAASRANQLRSRLQDELKNTITTPTENFKGEVIKKALQAVGVEFTGPKDVPIIIAQLKPTQKKQDFYSFLRLAVRGLRDEPKALLAYLKRMKSDTGSHEYNGEDGPEILARLEEITSMIPKALTDGSLSGNLGDTQYDTRTGDKQTHYSLAQTVGAPLKLIYRVVPRMRRAHATHFGDGLTVITQERPADETKVRWMSTALHETFHGVENANPVIKVLEWMFWRSRKKPGEDVVKLQDMPKGKGVGYGKDEIGVIDNWGNLYAGKVYNNYTGTTTGGPLENFEILTTGVQGIFYPETSASTLGDRDHLGFTMGILALVRKTTNNESSPTPNAATTSDDGLIRRDDIAEAGREAAESLSGKDTNRRRRRQKS